MAFWVIFWQYRAFFNKAHWAFKVVALLWIWKERIIIVLIVASGRDVVPCDRIRMPEGIMDGKMFLTIIYCKSHSRDMNKRPWKNRLWIWFESTYEKLCEAKNEAIHVLLDSYSYFKSFSIFFVMDFWVNTLQRRSSHWEKYVHAVRKKATSFSTLETLDRFRYIHKIAKPYAIILVYLRYRILHINSNCIWE